MRKSKNQAFSQAYNAQLGVDAEGSQLILGAYVSQSSADNSELGLKEARFNRARTIKKLEMRLNTWFAGKWKS
jgi:hypothetical protein